MSSTVKIAAVVGIGMKIRILHLPNFFFRERLTLEFTSKEKVTSEGNRDNLMVNDGLKNRVGYRFSHVCRIGY
jgi:hypothetical protein